MQTIRSVTEEFVRGTITAEEFEKARSNRLGNLPIRYETPSSVAAGLASVLSVGLPAEALHLEPSRYASVTLEDANRAAKERIFPPDMVWVVVGDKREIGETLERMGDVETVYYKEPLDAGNFITRTRLGVGLTWNSAARGPRISLLHRWLALSGVYGFSRSSEDWEYDEAVQVTFDLHRSNSEYSAGSSFVGATGTFAEGVRGITPHAGLRIFPYGLGFHYSISSEFGWSFWEKEDVDPPGFHWSLGAEYFF